MGQNYPRRRRVLRCKRFGGLDDVFVVRRAYGLPVARIPCVESRRDRWVEGTQRRSALRRSSESLGRRSDVARTEGKLVRRLIGFGLKRVRTSWVQRGSASVSDGVTLAIPAGGWQVRSPLRALGDQSRLEECV